MKKQLYFLAVSLLAACIFVGCNSDGSSANTGIPTEQSLEVTAQNNADLIPDTANTENPVTAAEPEGIYYPPIPENRIGYVFVQNAEVLFSFSYLYYNGSIYTSSHEISSAEKADIEAFAEGIKGGRLADVYSNRAIFWSADSSKLSHTDDNINGTIYSMTGYDEDFRVCVQYERYVEPMEETYYGFIVFDKLNNIIVNKGSDLFKDRLHLDEYSEIRINENGATYEETLSGDCSEFVQAIMDGKFIEADYDTREDFGKRESCTLVFYAENGLTTTISVFPDGYVSMTSGGNTFIEEVSPEACENIIKMAL
ncbi:MAG: hypothetical protein K2K57_12140 [Oscillospiraceae bacterium]|nr:hypothetical protein [Oscillospiraceae bacterium]